MTMVVSVVKLKVASAEETLANPITTKRPRIRILLMVFIYFFLY